jgi:hypothetical protein
MKAALVGVPAAAILALPVAVPPRLRGLKGGAT